MQNKLENEYLFMLTYSNLKMKKNMTRLWCKIMPKTSGGQIEGNEMS